MTKAYEKFSKKLNKIQYKKVLQLHKFYLDHLEKDKTYYGINLYRFERQNRLYSLTNEVNHLLRCKSDAERENVLRKSVILKDIHFPKLYDYFSGLQTYVQMILYVNIFLAFLKDLVLTSRLVIDKFIDEGLFGEDWEKLFLGIINEMAENVLYAPQTIDYSITPESQSAFLKIIAAPAIEIGSCLHHELYFEETNEEPDNDL